MQVRAWLYLRNAEGAAVASEAGRLAGAALGLVEEEFGRDGYNFSASLQPDPDGCLIEISFYSSTLFPAQVEARMPLLDRDTDLGFDRVEFGWED